MFDEAMYSEEELALFNPAFSGFLLHSSVKEFVTYKSEGLHCALPFLILPLSMNSSISANLPATYRTPIAAWVASHEGFIADLALQAEAHIPIVRSAINLLLSRDLLSISDGGRFLPGGAELTKNPALFGKSHDMNSALKTSRFLGRWFSHAPSTETIFAQFGLRP